MNIYYILKEPWVILEGQTALGLNNELRLEMVQDHPLYSKPLSALARSEACDDVLYQDQASLQYYLVHLTWAKQDSGKYPRYKLFNAFEDFIKYAEENFLFAEDFE